MRRIVRWIGVLAVVAGCADVKEPEPEPLPENDSLVVQTVAGHDAKPGDSKPKESKPKKPIQETFLQAPTAFFPGAPSAFRVVVSNVASRARTEPIEGARVRISLRKDGKEKAVVLDARTGANGSLDTSVPFPDVKDGDYQLLVETESYAGKEKNETQVSVSRRSKVLLVTDKPLYQPNQVVHMRALALHEFDLTPAAGVEVEIAVEDAKGNRIFKKKAKTGEFGEAALDVKLADEVNEGEWRIRATLAGVETEKAVSVKKYVLPKFKVAIDTGKGFYRPGDRVRGKIDVQYFFGKPVAGGQVTLVAKTFDVEFHEFARVTGKTDENGIYELDLVLPPNFAGQPLQNGDALVTLEASVKDGAEHVERGVKSWPVSANGYRIALAPESGRLVPDLENRVWAIATLPDGAPLAGVEVTLESAGKSSKATTDAAGIAQISYTPSLAGGMQWHWDGTQNLPVLQAQLTAISPAGEKIQRAEMLGTDQGGAVLLRLDKAIYAGGDTARVEVLTSKTKGAAYLDVVKQGQTMLTRTLSLSGSRARMELPLSHDLSGTLEIHAYVLQPDGNLFRDSKVVYVDPSGDLKITATPDKSVYRPGDQAKIRFKVVDGRGRGQAAAIAAVIVDESVYALQEIQPGLEKVYFTLEKELSEPRYEIHYGEKVASMVSDPPREARRQRAAEILLSKVETLRGPGWVVNPTQARVAGERQRFQWVANYLSSLAQQPGQHGVQSVVTGKWSWAYDPIEELKKRGWMNEAQLKDGFGNRITIDDLAEMGFPVEYDDIAAVITAQRLQTMYSAIVWYAQQDPKSIGRTAQTLWTNDPWRLPEDVLSRVEKRNLYGREQYRDLWGNYFRIEQSSADIPNRPYVYWQQLRRVRIYSLGPDGKSGTPDDVTEANLQGIAFWKNKLKDSLERQQIVLGAVGLDNDAMMEMPVMDARRGVGFGGGGRAAGGVAMPAPVAKVASQSAPDGNFRRDAKKGEVRQEAKIERVRQWFPETLLWNPALLTDRDGGAELTLPMADSITTWRLTCSANTKQGALGSCNAGLKVFQDFFVDLDLPVALTRGDEVSVPVAVYNYLEVPQEVRLEMQSDEWVELLSEKEQRITMKPGEVGVRYFRVRAKTVGWKKLEVRAYGPKMSDAVRKDVEVVPDGTAIEVAKSDRLGGEVTWDFDLPANAIPGANRAFVKLYPGAFSQVVEGLDGILQLPGG